MKNKNTEKIVTKVLLFPVFVLFLLCLLIITPFDYLKYKKSRYYKDTKEKYSWLCASSGYIEFYDMIKNEDLPIDFYRCDYAPITGYGFFVYKDILILNDYEPCYDEEKNIWLTEIEDEYIDIKVDAENAIDRCNELLKNDTCKKAVVLIDKDLYEKHPDVKYENVEFLPVDNDSDAKAIKKLLNIYEKSDTNPLPYMPSWDKIVELMYDKSLDSYEDEVINVFYSKNKSMRYLVLKDKKRIFTYHLEKIHQFDEDEWKYVSCNDGALPAMWESYSENSGGSLFSNEEDLMKDLKSQPEYTQYFI